MLLRFGAQSCNLFMSKSVLSVYVASTKICRSRFLGNDLSHNQNIIKNKVCMRVFFEN